MNDETPPAYPNAPTALQSEDLTGTTGRRRFNARMRDEGEEWKACCVCHEPRPYEDFPESYSDRSVDMLGSRCRPCDKARKKPKGVSREVTEDRTRDAVMAARINAAFGR